MVGFSFINVDEAQQFYNMVNKKIVASSVKPVKSSSFDASRLSVTAEIPSNAEQMPGMAPNSANSEKNSSRWIPSFFRDGGKKKPKSRQIGAPSNFQHLAHIGFDPVTGFDVKNIPPEWKILFDKAGVTREQLENKDTAKFIVDFVQSKGGPSGTTGKSLPASGAAVNRGPPPPLPSKLSRGPPPPPPARTDLGKAATNRGDEISPTKNTESISSAASSGIIPTFRPSTIINDDAKEIPPKTSRPQIDGGRLNLLQSIRDGGGISMLKPVADSPAPSPQVVTDTASTDMMASLLAKALADRNKKIAHSDTDESSDKDDEEW